MIMLTTCSVCVGLESWDVCFKVFIYLFIMPDATNAIDKGFRCLPVAYFILFIYIMDLPLFICIMPQTAKLSEYFSISSAPTR